MNCAGAVSKLGLIGFVFRLTASGCIDDETNIACFAVFVRRKTARSRADDGVFRKSLNIYSYRQKRPGSLPQRHFNA
jgi:hypothetical protein